MSDSRNFGNTSTLRDTLAAARAEASGAVDSQKPPVRPHLPTNSDGLSSPKLNVPRPTGIPRGMRPTGVPTRPAMPSNASSLPSLRPGPLPPQLPSLNPPSRKGPSLAQPSRPFTPRVPRMSDSTLYHSDLADSLPPASPLSSRPPSRDLIAGPTLAQGYPSRPLPPSSPGVSVQRPPTSTTTSTTSTSSLRPSSTAASSTSSVSVSAKPTSASHARPPPPSHTPPPHAATRPSRPPSAAAASSTAAPVPVPSKLLLHALSHLAVAPGEPVPALPSPLKLCSVATATSVCGNQEKRLEIVRGILPIAYTLFSTTNSLYNVTKTWQYLPPKHLCWALTLFLTLAVPSHEDTATLRSLLTVAPITSTTVPSISLSGISLPNPCPWKNPDGTLLVLPVPMPSHIYLRTLTAAASACLALSAVSELDGVTVTLFPLLVGVVRALTRTLAPASVSTSLSGSVCEGGRGREGSDDVDAPTTTTAAASGVAGVGVYDVSVRMQVISTLLPTLASLLNIVNAQTALLTPSTTTTLTNTSTSSTSVSTAASCMRLLADASVLQALSMLVNPTNMIISASAREGQRGSRKDKERADGSVTATTGTGMGMGASKGVGMGIHVEGDEDDTRTHTARVISLSVHALTLIKSVLSVPVDQLSTMSTEMPSSDNNCKNDRQKNGLWVWQKDLVPDISTAISSLGFFTEEIPNPVFPTDLYSLISQMLTIIPNTISVSPLFLPNVVTQLLAPEEIRTVFSHASGKLGKEVVFSANAGIVDSSFISKISDSFALCLAPLRGSPYKYPSSSSSCLPSPTPDPAFPSPLPSPPALLPTSLPPPLVAAATRVLARCSELPEYRPLLATTHALPFLAHTVASSPSVPVTVRALYALANIIVDPGMYTSGKKSGRNFRKFFPAMSAAHQLFFTVLCGSAPPARHTSRPSSTTSTHTHTATSTSASASAAASPPQTASQSRAVPFVAVLLALTRYHADALIKHLAMDKSNAANVNANGNKGNNGNNAAPSTNTTTSTTSSANPVVNTTPHISAAALTQLIRILANVLLHPTLAPALLAMPMLVHTLVAVLQALTVHVMQHTQPMQNTPKKQQTYYTTPMLIDVAAQYPYMELLLNTVACLTNATYYNFGNIKIQKNEDVNSAIGMLPSRSDGVGRTVGVDNHDELSSNGDYINNGDASRPLSSSLVSKLPRHTTSTTSLRLRRAGCDSDAENGVDNDGNAEDVPLFLRYTHAGAVLMPLQALLSLFLRCTPMGSGEADDNATADTSANRIGTAPITRGANAADNGNDGAAHGTVGGKDVDVESAPVFALEGLHESLRLLGNLVRVPLSAKTGGRFGAEEREGEGARAGSGSGRDPMYIDLARIMPCLQTEHPNVCVSALGVMLNAANNATHATVSTAADAGAQSDENLKANNASASAPSRPHMVCDMPPALIDTVSALALESTHIVAQYVSTHANDCYADNICNSNDARDAAAVVEVATIADLCVKLLHNVTHDGAMREGVHDSAGRETGAAAHAHSRAGAGDSIGGAWVCGEEAIVRVGFAMQAVCGLVGEALSMLDAMKMEKQHQDSGERNQDNRSNDNGGSDYGAGEEGGWVGAHVQECVYALQSCVEIAERVADKCLAGMDDNLLSDVDNLLSHDGNVLSHDDTYIRDDLEVLPDINDDSNIHTISRAHTHTITHPNTRAHTHTVGVGGDDNAGYQASCGPASMREWLMAQTQRVLVDNSGDSHASRREATTAASTSTSTSAAVTSSGRAGAGAAGIAGVRVGFSSVDIGIDASHAHTSMFHAPLAALPAHTPDDPGMGSGASAGIDTRSGVSKDDIASSAAFASALTRPRTAIVREAGNVYIVEEPSDEE